MKMMKLITCILLCLLLIACDKHKNEWWITGKVTEGLTGLPLSNIQVKAEVKKLQSGVYNDIITTAAEGVSESDGSFELIWKRENISYCKLVASKDQYFDAVAEVSPDDMKPGEPFVQALELIPIANVQINLASTDPSALVKLSVFSSDQFCSCNDQNEYSIIGLKDTTVQCVTGGGKWLKYQIQAFGSGGNVYHLDSILCQPFVVNQIQYTY